MKEKLLERIQQLYEESEDKFAEIDGRRVCMFDEPLVGFGSVKDPLFAEYKKEGVIGPWFMGPEEWLPEAKSVISLFFPISEEVRKSNRGDIYETSKEWTYSRVDGQEFIKKFIETLRDELKEEGIQAVAPAADERLRAAMNGTMEGFEQEGIFGSNWSERHVAYLCGLGTFGLSKGLITKKGMAGRFTSVILSMELEADERPYTGLYDYCIQCGACIPRCPVQAISQENGKEHIPCLGRMIESKKQYAPRLGCGKCQVAVPCEDCIPVKRK